MVHEIFLYEKVQPKLLSVNLNRQYLQNALMYNTIQSILKMRQLQLSQAPSLKICYSLKSTFLV